MYAPVAFIGQEARISTIFYARNGFIDHLSTISCIKKHLSTIHYDVKLMRNLSAGH
jgi:hypothetical protein